VTAFELSHVGGPWLRRIAPRRAWIDALPWDHALVADPSSLATARTTWTRTAFSEYASAAAFAEIATALLAAGAPIDLVACAGDFVVDEIVHAECAARITAWLGGAIALEVDLARLVRPPRAEDPLLAAVERIVRTSCVGESLTVPMLKLARDETAAPVIAAALAKIVADESAHAQFGWWVLDWACDELDDAARAHLAAVAAHAIESFAPVVNRDAARCSANGLGTLGCATFDPVFAAAIRERVVAPLAERGIHVSLLDHVAPEAPRAVDGVS
jgi:hypothetical protein